MANLGPPQGYRARCAHCNQEHVFFQKPPICPNCRTDVAMKIGDNLTYAAAIKDANAQGILKTFMVQIGMLLQDYDMQDSVFGTEVQKLMDSYYADMNA